MSEVPPSSEYRKPPSQEEIARFLGISAMTVSRALRGAPRVSEKTRRRVEKAAEELGFRPNPLLRAHMANLRRQSDENQANIAWISSPSKPSTRQAQAEIEQGARQHAESLGYGLDILHYDGTKMSASYLKHLFRARGVYGCIVGPLTVPGIELDLPWDEFAFAAIGRSLRSPSLHYSMHHDYHGIERVLQELIRRGYQRIAFLYARPWDERIDHAPVMVYQHYYQYRNNSILLEPQFYHGWTTHDYRKWLNEMKPDVVIADYVYVARFLQQAGAELPGDISFVSLSWKQNQPEVTGIRKRFDTMGASAVDLVVGQLHRNERGIPLFPKAVLLEGEWMEGQTIHPAT